MSNLTKCSCAFQLTLNQIDKFEEVKSYVKSLKSFQYGIACKEIAPTTLKEHIHIYIQFSRSVRLSLSGICHAHVEKCRGSAQQNIDYIKKDGDIIWEDGEVKKKGAKTIEDIKKMNKEDRDLLPAQLYNIVQKINMKETNEINIDSIFKSDIEVIYIYGDSGVGKTKKAMEIFKEKGKQIINMVKYENGFWNGLGESDACLYDDFRDSHMKPSEFINFIDYNKHQMNIKGGYQLNEYKLIIITSVQSPNDIYKNVDGEPRKQWMRRMKVVHVDSL